MASESDIISFLHDVKTADKIIFINTDKNRRTRLSLGIQTEDMEDIIRGLNKDEYYDGPLEDRDPLKPGKLWIFKHHCFGHLLYIKLKEKIIIDNKIIVKCLSCHIDFII